MDSTTLESIEKIEDYSGFRKRDKKSVWIFKLEADYRYPTGLKTDFFDSNWLRIDTNGVITVYKGYAWDGCSFKFNLFDLAVAGTPDGIIDITSMKPKTYYASLVHDALYQYLPYHSISRRQADIIFYELLAKAGFIPRKIYYLAVRLVGGCFGAQKVERKYQFNTM